VDLGADSTTGVCVANGDSAGQCNLRAALLAARASTGMVTIDLSVDSVVDAGQIEVGASSAGTSSFVLESAPGGAAHAIQGGAFGRLFAVDSGVSLTVNNLSIANFSAEDSGGAIVNSGDLDLEGVTIAGNTTHCWGTGAMTAFATCSGGAIANSGTLTLGGGTRFTDNGVTADASTASYTTAWAGGGAVLSSGTIAIVGPVTFSGNAANAQASSGDHGEPIGGADSSAAGGAIYNTGGLRVTAPAGSCQFNANSANASGTTPHGSITLTSRGGAIENTGAGTLQIPAGACVFSGNSAQSGPDVGE
jgi:fibronectin-binding autotransporter adhesin